MKTLAFTVLVLLLVYSTNAQMSLQDPSPLLNLDRNMEYILYKPAPMMEGRHPTHYGAAAVLFGTFLINHVIIVNAEKKGNFEFTTRRVGTMYTAGMALTIGVYIFENRKARWDKLYDDQESENQQMIFQEIMLY